MFDARFEFSLRQGELTLPKGGKSVVFFPERVEDIAPLSQYRPKVVHRFLPTLDLFEAHGFEPFLDLSCDLDLALVHVPRAKRLGRHLIYKAAKAIHPDGLILLDGAKSQGVESLIKDLKRRTELGGVVSKAHGKLAWFQPCCGFDDWKAPDFDQIEDGFVTKVGVFSADGIDPASRLLVEALPTDIKGKIADFGAGWGYLTRHLLALEDITHIDCVEADRAALDCARQNCADHRVSFQWQDATTWRANDPLDAIVMNPPFHHGRAAEPAIGKAFISSAARNLAAHGCLFLVANRQLPYEEILNSHFANVKQISQNNRFKVLFARRPLEHLRKTR